MGKIQTDEEILDKINNDLFKDLLAKTSLSVLSVQFEIPYYRLKIMVEKDSVLREILNSKERYKALHPKKQFRKQSVIVKKCVLPKQLNPDGVSRLITAIIKSGVVQCDEAFFSENGLFENFYSGFGEYEDRKYYLRLIKKLKGEIE